MSRTSEPRRLHALDEAQIEQLAQLLIDCTEGGASVGFMLPLSLERAALFWRRVADGVVSGERALLVVEDAHGICGTVQLVFAQLENQPHRADVSKLLVHQRARRKGIGDALVTAAETLAQQTGRTLLVLDTATPDAARLYERHQWIRAGVVPNYALLPEGGFCDTTFYYRKLD